MIHGPAAAILVAVSLAAAALILVRFVRRLRVSRHGAAWLAFTAQALAAVSIQVFNDVSTGYFSHYGSALGIANAHRVVAFEAGHGFWFEPAWQTFFARPHHLLFVTLTWTLVSHAMVYLYVAAHVLVTLAVGLWVWVRHRRWFPLMRNTLFLTNLVALAFYENLPVAPPRLTPGLLYHGRPFTFRDPLYHMLYGPHIPVTAKFNEFSAIPSMHIGWALIVGLALLLLAGQWAGKLAGAAYPFLVLIVIVVTGNHYILDGIIAAGVVLAAGLLALAIEVPRTRLVAFALNRLGSPPRPRPRPALAPLEQGRG
jgi:hypothetical protein